MPKPWDEMMKRLIESHPQDYVSWVLQGARVEGILKQELQQTMFADSLIKVVVEGQPAIIHFEFQTVRDPYMGERTSLYNLLASHLNNYVPVWSYVVYLRPDEKLEEPPFVRIFPGQREISRFNYNRIDLWTLSAEEVLALPSEGLLPLVLLTRDGTEPDVVEDMIEKVADTGDKELLAAAYTLGGLVFKKPDEQNWFKRRFAVFENILEESWTFQEWKQEFTEKAEAKAEAAAAIKVAQAQAEAAQAQAEAAQAQAEAAQRADELKEKLERELVRVEKLQRQLIDRSRTTLVTIIEKHFPTVTPFVHSVSNVLNDPEILSDLIVDVSTAQTPEEVTDMLINAVKKEGELAGKQEKKNTDE